MINMLDPDQRARARDLASRRWHSNGTCEMADMLGAAIDYIEELEAARDCMRAERDLYETYNFDLKRVVALAHEWNRLDAHRLGHTGDANCCAGDHDTCEAIPARDALSAALDALDPKEATCRRGSSQS